MDNNEAMKRFGRFVRDRREEMGLSQQQLADRVGSSRAYVSRLELGNAGPLWVEVLYALAKGLETDESLLRQELGLPIELYRHGPREKKTALPIPDGWSEAETKEVVDFIQWVEWKRKRG